MIYDNFVPKENYRVITQGLIIGLGLKLPAFFGKLRIGALNRTKKWLLIAVPQRISYATTHFSRANNRSEQRFDLDWLDSVGSVILP